VKVSAVAKTSASEITGAAQRSEDDTSLPTEEWSPNDRKREL
jgi:hypothetical protein